MVASPNTRVICARPMPSIASIGRRKTLNA